MIRVYLDWNIFSYLKRLGDIEEPYISLKKILQSYSDVLLIPYSFAHLNDLSVSYKQGGKGMEMSIVDLENLKILSKDQALIYDYKKGITEARVYDIKEYFFYLIENNTEIPTTFSGLFENDFYDIEEDAEFKELLRKIREPIFNFGIGGIPDNMEFVEKYFEEFIDNPNFENLFNGFLNFFENLTSDNKLYAGLRNSFLDDYNLRHNYKESQDALHDIDKKLLNSPYKKKFEELVKHVLSLKGDINEKSYKEIFTTHFLALDYLGFYSDKKFTNLIQDSFHSFFGAHCDFFITDDNNTYQKSKLIYKHFNIETVVCKSDEFIANFYKKAYLKGGVKQNLIKTIREFLGKGLVYMRTQDDEFNPVDIYKFDHYLVNYFNRMQVSYYLNETFLTLYKNPKNYSKSYFFAEISSIVNGVINELGFDYYGKGYYHSEIEDQSLNEGKWNGRLWYVEGVMVTMEMMDYPFGMALKIRLPKN